MLLSIVCFTNSSCVDSLLVSSSLRESSRLEEITRFVIKTGRKKIIWGQKKKHMAFAPGQVSSKANYGC